MLEEMIKSYPGVEGILEADGPAAKAVIEFNSPDSAKFAVVGLNRLKVDQSGSKCLKVDENVCSAKSISGAIFPQKKI